MERLTGRIRPYAWGSPAAIPEFFGYRPAEGPVAEVWLGAHREAPARLGAEPHAPLFDLAELYPSEAASHAEAAGLLADAATGGQAAEQVAAGLAAQGQGEGERQTLDAFVARDPLGTLGASVAERYGGELPYLLKLIAPREPLSLQVHPNLAQAREGYAAEEAAGVPRTSRERNYRDANHKPELAFALTQFEALAGLRTPRRIHEVIGGLGVPLADRLDAAVREGGVAEAFRLLLAEETRPAPEEVDALAAACARRPESASPSPRADAVVRRLASKYPGDPGVIASLLLNPVTLRPGEALFIPAGTVHAYLSGMAVEVMAASDNVVRAGLTAKYVDVAELLRIVDSSAAPPIRIAPERMGNVLETFYAPVDDFELSSIHLVDASVLEPIRTTGPRTLVCLTGAAQVHCGGERAEISAGQALFIREDEGALALRGFGTFVLASVP